MICKHCKTIFYSQWTIYTSKQIYIFGEKGNVEFYGSNTSQKGCSRSIKRGAKVGDIKRKLLDEKFVANLVNYQQVI